MTSGTTPRLARAFPPTPTPLGARSPAGRPGASAACLGVEVRLRDPAVRGPGAAPSGNAPGPARPFPPAPCAPHHTHPPWSHARVSHGCVRVPFGTQARGTPGPGGASRACAHEGHRTDPRTRERARRGAAVPPAPLGSACVCVRFVPCGSGWRMSARVLGLGGRQGRTKTLILGM